MCLEERTKKRFKYEKQVLDGVTYNVGYKKFSIRIGGKLYGQWRNSHKVRPTNTWLHEKDFRTDSKESVIYPNYNNKVESYLSGWHIYIDSHFPRSNKVLFKTPVAKGTEYGKQVVVAKWIYILS